MSHGGWVRGGVLLNRTEGVSELLVGTPNYNLFILDNKNICKNKMLEVQHNFYQHTGCSGYAFT